MKFPFVQSDVPGKGPWKKGPQPGRRPSRFATNPLGPVQRGWSPHKTDRSAHTQNENSTESYKSFGFAELLFHEDFSSAPWLSINFVIPKFCHCMLFLYLVNLFSLNPPRTQSKSRQWNVKTKNQHTEHREHTENWSPEHLVFWCVSLSSNIPEAAIQQWHVGHLRTEDLGDFGGLQQRHLHHPQGNSRHLRISDVPGRRVPVEHPYHWP